MRKARKKKVVRIQIAFPNFSGSVFPVFIRFTCFCILIKWMACHFMFAFLFEKKNSLLPVYQYFIILLFEYIYQPYLFYKVLTYFIFMGVFLEWTSAINKQANK